MPLIITRTQKDLDILVECGMDPRQEPVKEVYTDMTSEVTFKVTQDIVDKLDINNRHDNTMQLLALNASSSIELKYLLKNLSKEELIDYILNRYTDESLIDETP
jgi:hypothetical protein